MVSPLYTLRWLIISLVWICFVPFNTGGDGWQNLVDNSKQILPPLLCMHEQIQPSPSSTEIQSFPPQLIFYIYPNSIENSLFIPFFKMFASEAWNKFIPLHPQFFLTPPTPPSVLKITPWHCTGSAPPTTSCGGRVGIV